MVEVFDSEVFLVLVLGGVGFGLLFLLILDVEFEAECQAVFLLAVGLDAVVILILVVGIFERQRVVLKIFGTADLLDLLDLEGFDFGML